MTTDHTDLIALQERLRLLAAKAPTMGDTARTLTQAADALEALKHPVSTEPDPFDDCLGVHVQANAKRLGIPAEPSGEVVQADRTAAARFKPFCGETVRGLHDDLELVQAFASHALAARIEGARAMQEAAEKIAAEWLASDYDESANVIAGSIAVDIKALNPTTIAGGE